MKSGVTRVLVAKDIMTAKLVTLSPTQSVFDAISLLLKRKVSGAPVVEGGQLLGMLSEHDCLRVLTSGEFFSAERSCAESVADLMTPVRHVVAPDTDIYTIAQLFFERAVRRAPVVGARGELLGQVSRRDVLAGIDRMGRDSVRPARPSQYPEVMGVTLNLR